jgi:hypothetical protein
MGFTPDKLALNFSLTVKRVLPSAAIEPTRGLYYKHITIVNDDSGVVSKCHSSLIGDAIVVIYDRGHR